MRVRRRLVLWASLGTAVAVLCTAPAGAAPQDQWAALSAAEREDLTLIAESEGIGTDEAMERVAWQNDFAMAATAVQEAYPESFAHAEIASEVPAVGSISFVGPVPVDVYRLLASVPEGVNVELVPGAELSAAAVDAAIIKVHHAVSGTGLVGDVVTSYDREAGLVQVAAQPKSAEDLTGQEQAIRSLLPGDLPPFELILDPQLEGGGGDVRKGGGRLEVSGEGYLECTAGFNVIKPNGTTGVATAGHCLNNLTHENKNGDPEVDLNFQAGHRGDWGDFQWHTSTEGESDNFFYNWNSTRDVIATSNPVDGQTLCRFGQNTGATCSGVNDLSVCHTVDGFTYCRLVRMNDDEADGGDSGGPWYYGETAYGYHQGYVGSGCGFLGLSSCDVWSRASYIDEALGVSVRAN